MNVYTHKCTDGFYLKLETTDYLRYTLLFFYNTEHSVSMDNLMLTEALKIWSELIEHKEKRNMVLYKEIKDEIYKG